MERLCYHVVYIFIIIARHEYSAVRFNQLNDIRTYELVSPIQHGSTHNGLSTRINEHEHIEKTIFQFFAFKRNFDLQLFKNKLLIPPGYVKFQQHSNGSTFYSTGVEHCYYQGYIGNRTKSAIAVTTCKGLEGYIRDGNEDFLIEPLVDDNATSYQDYPNRHIIYRTKDVVYGEKHSCGVNDTYHHEGIYHKGNGQSFSYSVPNVFGNTSVPKGFEKTREKTKYITVVLVMDHAMFVKHQYRTEQRAISVMNYVDLIYKIMNTRIALQTLKIWNKNDKIKITKIAKDTLREFSVYTQNVLFGSEKLNADSAVLITGVPFDGGSTGLAGGKTMCTLRSSALVTDWATQPWTIGNTVAHEIGHTLGMRHTKAGCKCPLNPCVMSTTAPFDLCRSFTDCAQDMFQKRLKAGSLTCLFDYPDELYGKPKCGNGFREVGEDCDCGSEEDCKKTGADKCCIAKTCKLRETAACATGACCNASTCQLKSRGELCRKVYDTDCDLPEYCTGRSNRCPQNVYTEAGRSCLSASGYGICYQGSCKSLTEQCQILWGPNAINAVDGCYNENTRTEPKNLFFANCGKVGEKYIPCDRQDMFCGTLQCGPKDNAHPLPYYPVIGGELGGRMVKIVTFGNHQCRMAYVPHMREAPDPSMVLEGTACGKGKICQHHKCKYLSILTCSVPCNTHCFNGGVCNNKGHCHCKSNYSCPTCQHFRPGVGGSYDSGQGCEDISKGRSSKLIIGVAIPCVLIISLVILGVIKRRALRSLRAEMEVRWMMYRSPHKDSPPKGTFNKCLDVEPGIDAPATLHGVTVTIVQGNKISTPKTPNRAHKPPPKIPGNQSLQQPRTQYSSEIHECANKYSYDINPKGVPEGSLDEPPAYESVVINTNHPHAYNEPTTNNSFVNRLYLQNPRTSTHVKSWISRQEIL